MVIGELHQTHTFEVFYTGWLWRAAALFLWAGRYRRLTLSPMPLVRLFKDKSNETEWTQSSDLNRDPRGYGPRQLPLLILWNIWCQTLESDQANRRYELQL